MSQLIIRIAAAACVALAITPAVAQPDLVIRLVDTQIIPQKALTGGVKAAGHILTLAGVHVRWMDCAVEECASTSSLWIQFVKRRPNWLPLDTAGYAVMSPPAGIKTRFAMVAYRPDMTNDLLGATLAHEIGHLLLGKGHTLNGIMVARFRPTELAMAGRGGLRFSNEQARKMREILACCLSEPGSRRSISGEN